MPLAPVPFEVSKKNGMFGVNQRKVLDSIPSDWTIEEVNSGNGWKALDENNVERIRFMRPNADGRFTHQISGYWRFKNAQGEWLDEFGNVVSETDANFDGKTHIPYTGVRR